MKQAQVTQVGPEFGEILSALHTTSFSKPWNSSAFTTLLQQPGVKGWIYENPTPSGFILVRAVAEEAEILTFAVSPKDRRREIGKLLLNTACSTLREAGISFLFLEVSTENLAALALYRKLGFAQVGKRAAYYDEDTGGGAQTSSDAIVMRLDI